MELNPQQSYKSVSEMHDRLTTYRQLEAELANLRAQLSALQQREAMLVEAVKFEVDHCADSYTKQRMIAALND